MAPKRSPREIIVELCSDESCGLKMPGLTQRSLEQIAGDDPDAVTNMENMSLPRYLTTYVSSTHDYLAEGASVQKMMNNGVEPDDELLPPSSLARKRLLAQFPTLSTEDHYDVYEALMKINDGLETAEACPEILAKLPQIVAFARAIEHADIQRINREADWEIQQKCSDPRFEERVALEQSINDDRTKEVLAHRDNIKTIDNTIKPLVAELMESLGMNEGRRY